mgnify:CR=1 FL=1
MRPWKNSAWQFVIKWALWIVGTLYFFIEKLRDYPNEERDNILGLPIDEDLREMSRYNLCTYMDSGFPKAGFWDLNSTTKIRLGAQLMRNLLFKKPKPKKKKINLKNK